MEKRNTILLTVIAIATLLVAVVGATFAYFTAQTQTSGNATVNASTTELKGATIEFNGLAKKFDLLNYPGGIGVYGASATISKADDTEVDKNEYEATFNLKIEYTNTTTTDLEWELYMVESEVDGLDAEAATVCKLNQATEGNVTKLWYADADAEAAATTDKGCTAKGITGELTKLNATKLAHGKLKASQAESQTIDKNTQKDEYFTQDDGNLEGRKINTKSKPTKYYYLVVKYPNENKDQNTAGEKQTINVTLSIDGTPASQVYTGE